MNQRNARSFIEALAWMEWPLGEIDTILSGMEDDTERNKIKEKVACFFSCQFDLINLVVNQHPSLDPDGEGADSYRKLKEKYTIIE